MTASASADDHNFRWNGGIIECLIRCLYIFSVNVDEVGNGWARTRCQDDVSGTKGRRNAVSTQDVDATPIDEFPAPLGNIDAVALDN